MFWGHLQGQPASRSRRTLLPLALLPSLLPQTPFKLALKLLALILVPHHQDLYHFRLYYRDHFSCEQFGHEKGKKADRVTL